MPYTQYPRTKMALLSPLDQLNSSFYLRWSLMFQVKDLNKAVGSLSKALSVVTTTLPYLKGRIIYLTDNNKVGARAVISMSDDSPNVLLRERRPATELPSLERTKQEGGPAYLFTDDLYSLPVLIDVTSKKSHPVFETTYAPVEGGLVLSMCVHHGVMDARGLAILTRLWASFTRQQDQDDNNGFPMTLPDPNEPLTRTTRLTTSANDTAESGITDIETISRHYQNDRILEQDIPLPTEASGPRSSKIFRFSGDKLQYTKSFLVDNNCHVTINSILSAVIWCNVTRIRLSRRPQPPIQSSRFFQMVDGGRRLGPTINEPGPYLGNVVLTSSVDVSLDALATTSAFDKQSISLMAPVMQAICDASAQITSQYISGFLEMLQQVEDLGSLGIGRMSQHGVDFTSSNWADLPLYECDFGPLFSQDCAEGNEGKPVFVRYPYVNWADGNMIVLPRQKTTTGQDEVIEAYIMLVEDDLIALAEDTNFCSWLKD
uniref:Acyltransferase n=1 Tax=Fusarium kyushuense TaxID=56665 RepID=D2JLZ0_9HYPO|nr:acyltransferase [Fusarium kyushuense]